MQNLPFKVDWYIANRVLLITVIGEISGKELHQMEIEAYEYIRTAPCEIHAIVDLQRLSVRPQNLQEAIKNTGQLKHKNQGTSVIVAAPMHPVVKFICSGVMTALRLKYVICDSLDEAKEKIDALEGKRPNAGANSP